MPTTIRFIAAQPALYECAGDENEIAGRPSLKHDDTWHVLFAGCSHCNLRGYCENGVCKCSDTHAFWGPNCEREKI